MTAPIPIVIDTDVGADPDDALALILALASPEVDVRGVTIVSGDVGWRARIATRLLGMAGRSDVPVFLGRGEPRQMSGAEGEGLLDLPYHGPEATVQTTSAVDWLLAESRRGSFHLVAIGPLTNVAAAIEKDREFAGRLLGLTVMGGLLDERTMPIAWQRAILERGGAGWPDYNTTCDPAAALTVARCGIHITWVTLDATMRAPLRAAARGLLPPEQPLGAALGRMIDAWHAVWFPTALPPPDDPSPVPVDAVAILHDPLAVAALFPAEWLRLRPTRLAYGIEDGVFRLREQPGGAPGRLAAEVDGAAFESFLVTRIVRQLGQLSASTSRFGTSRSCPLGKLDHPHYAVSERTFCVRTEVSVGDWLPIGPTGHQGYLAVPERGSGPGVLVLHAWWGLTPVFTDVCDRLATAGYVALAPGLFPGGATAATIAEAEVLRDAHDEAGVALPVVQAAAEQLRGLPAVTGAQIGIIGFSLGAYWALHLSQVRPDDVSAVVAIYGTDEGDYRMARAAYLGHFAEHDDFEPLEAVRALEEKIRASGCEVTFHVYPGTGHWFVEPNRPDVYNAAAAELVWERTLAFLKAQLA